MFGYKNSLMQQSYYYWAGSPLDASHGLSENSPCYDIIPYVTVAKQLKDKKLCLVSQDGMMQFHFETE